jgi:hypothetical protein
VARMSTITAAPGAFLFSSLVTAAPVRKLSVGCPFCSFRPPAFRDGVTWYRLPGGHQFVFFIDSSLDIPAEDFGACLSLVIDGGISSSSLVAVEVDDSSLDSPAEDFGACLSLVIDDSISATTLQDMRSCDFAHS